MFGIFSSFDFAIKWVIPFLSVQGYGREILWGCARNILQGSQGLKSSFQGGQGKSSRGVIPIRTSLPVASHLED